MIDHATNEARALCRSATLFRAQVCCFVKCVESPDTRIAGARERCTGEIRLYAFGLGMPCLPGSLTHDRFSDAVPLDKGYPFLLL